MDYIMYQVSTFLKSKFTNIRFALIHYNYHKCLKMILYIIYGNVYVTGALGVYKILRRVHFKQNIKLTVYGIFDFYFLNYTFAKYRIFD